MKPSTIAQDKPEGKTALDGGKVDSNAPSGIVGAGKCLGCGNRDCAGCPITPESIRREVLEAVTPLVLALERLAEDQDSTTFARRNAARRICEEVRKKWGEG